MWEKKKNENKTYTRLDSQFGLKTTLSTLNINWLLTLVWTLMSWMLNLPRGELCIENLTMFCFRKIIFTGKLLK